MPQIKGLAIAIFENETALPQNPGARGFWGGGIWGNTSGRFISVLKCYNLFRIAILPITY
ncbi:hypothetical protein PL10110_540066 [Planktothrix agardhii]|nr:hypothetical protein PL10110_540066 [Planktothrix agardhii]